MLDSVPDSQMVQHLPEFLDPLFNILDDPCPEISTLCDNLLGEFLGHIIDKPEVSLDRIRARFRTTDDCFRLLISPG